VRDAAPVSVKVVAMKADTEFSQPVREDITDCREFDLTLSRRMAIRLLNLSHTALNVVEDTLLDPDARRTDKLRAAKLVGDWIGLGSQARHPSGDFVSVPSRVEQVFATRLAPPVQTSPLVAPRQQPLDYGEEE
jgi:hypothetical protein